MRALDIFIWAVFLGSRELAGVLRTECQEPLRAALMGSKICLAMAELLPIETAELTVRTRIRIFTRSPSPNPNLNSKPQP